MQSNNLKIKNNLNSNDRYLCKNACKNIDAIYLREDEQDIRPIFLRDVDRIIYSNSYSRYLNKTQVYTYPGNDHITHRIQHVQFVSKIARTIGRALKLNEDLIEAMALGHDIGHAAFGHAGESELNRICKRENIGYFCHNAQSVRTLKDLENKNISVQTLDGILAHNGEILLNKYAPNFNKTTKEFLEDLDCAYSIDNYSKKIKPMTLEGCVVRISDIIAYIGRDIEDAIVLGNVSREELPKNVITTLGNKNSMIIETLEDDLIENSIDKDYICFSEEIFLALKELLKWNYENIYAKASLEEKASLHYKFDRLFEVYLNKLEKYDYMATNFSLKSVNESEKVFEEFLTTKSKKYLENTNSKRIVIDYIAGFTDGFFKREYDIYK